MYKDVCKHYLCRDLCGECQDETTRAARLILAAPDLYEALETMLEMSELNGFGKAYAEDMARQALAKARGKQL